MRDLSIISLKDEELEALFLADVREMEQEAAAAQMNISRPTFSRILAAARKATATALAEGSALKIEGGDFVRIKQRRVRNSSSETGKGTDDARNG